jgi:hypothetical protein
VDIATGMIVCSAGADGGPFQAAAPALADEARVGMQAHQGGDLEEVSVATRGRYQLSRILDSRPGEGLLLFVDFDRARTNMALAGWQVSQAASALLA